MTRPSLSLLAWAALLPLALPSSALAVATPQQVIEAMGVDPDDLVPGSIETPGTSAGMFDVSKGLGVINPWSGGSMAVLYTGTTDPVLSCQDHDWPPAPGEEGDRVTLRFQLTVPEWAHSFAFYTFFLSREYPEYVGSEFNDVYNVELQSEAYTGPIVFDAFGNPVTINSALFAVTNPAQLVGTCFDEDGGTGWITTTVPANPGDVITLTFEIWDVSDGIFDSMALVDDFAFDETEVKEPIIDPTPVDPLRIGFVSPKEGPLEGGGDVTIHGFGFTETTTVTWDDVELTNLTLGTGGETLRISGIPGADEPGSITIGVDRGPDSAELQGAYTYYAEGEGEIRPSIHWVRPAEAHPDGGTTLRVEGTGFDAEAEVVLIDADGVELDADVDGVIGPQDELQELVAVMPAHVEGFVDLHVVNPGGLMSDPGYPVLYTSSAAPPPIDDRRVDDCACSTGLGAAGSSAWLLGLLGVFGVTRRRSR